MRTPLPWALFTLVAFTGPWALAAAPVTWQEKVVMVGVPFRVSIAPETPDDHYAISEINPAFLSNIDPLAPGAMSNLAPAEGVYGFQFQPLSPGLSFLAIDRLRGNDVEKRFLYYRITILPDSKQDAIAKAITRKKADLKAKVDEEQASYQMAKQLADARLYDSAIKECDAYEAKFPTGALLHAITRLKGDIRLTQSNYPAAVDVYTRYLSRAELKDKERAEALVALADANLSNQQSTNAIENYMRVATRYKDSPTQPDALLSLGQLLIKERRFAAAFPYFESYYQKFAGTPQGLQSPRMDEALYGMAAVYEYDPNLRDVKKSMDFYRLIIEKTPFSPLVDEAKKRLRYLDRNFLQIR